MQEDSKSPKYGTDGKDYNTSSLRKDYSPSKVSLTTVTSVANLPKVYLENQR
jgi:hypothetical protein